MSRDTELAERAEYIDREISRVRGRAQTTDGSVVIETNPYGSITDLRITYDVNGVDPGRLSAVIMELHRRAYEEAKANGAEVFQAIQARAQARTAAALPAEEWEEAVSVRFTTSI